MRPQAVISLLQVVIRARLALLLVGPPGVGKSDLVAQATASSGADLILSHPVVNDPTDIKGIPWPDANQTEATFLPFGDLSRALAAERLTVWMLDDLGQAPPAVQASYMQLLLARRVNGHVLPDCVTFIAASNRRGDRAGVGGLLEPVKSRFASIVELETNLDDWCQWAMESGIRPEVIAFLRFRPELLHQFVPSRDLKNSPCPRTWAHVSHLMDAGLPKEIELQTYQGAVGEGPAAEFVGFLRVYRQLPNPDTILMDPDHAPVPSNPSALYAVASLLATRATEKNFDRVMAYVRRMPEEFGILAARDASRRNPLVSHTAAWQQFATSDLGRIAIGVN